MCVRACGGDFTDCNFQTNIDSCVVRLLLLVKLILLKRKHDMLPEG